MGPSGPLEVSHEALWRWIDFYEVEQSEKEFCFDLVHKACLERIELLRVKKEEQNRRNKRDARLTQGVS